MRIMTGIDMHVKLLVCEMGFGKKEPDRFSVPNDFGGHLELINRIEKLKEKYKASGVIIAHEASGLGYTLYDTMTEKGYQCAILAPTKIPKGAKAYKHKNDKRDAHDIYEVVRGHELAGNQLPDTWVPDKEIRGDRDVVRTLFDLSEKVAKTKIQIQALLKKYGIKKLEEINCWTKPFKQWLNIQKESMSREFKICLGTLQNQLGFLEIEKDNIENEVEIISKKERYRKPFEKLIEIKGVGVKTAMTFLTEIGDVTRFHNRREIGSYIGLAPSSFESGDASDRKGRITRDGPYRLRSILNQAVWTHLNYNGAEKAVYNRIADRNPKRKKKAVVACMRRLAIRMWHAACEGVEEAMKTKRIA